MSLEGIRLQNLRFAPYVNRFFIMVLMISLMIIWILVTDKVEYYAKKGEKFYLNVHIYNPSNFEILSFTLNNYKYQSFEFKEGSSSNKLIIEVDAGVAG